MQPYFVSDPLLARRVGATKRLAWLRRAALAFVFAACGPPLTQPSSLDLTGRWTSAEHIGPVFNLEVVIDQNPDGTIVGTWSGDVSPPNPACPPNLSDRATGIVSGSNTVVGVQFALVGAGDFLGQASDVATLRGSFQSCGQTYAIMFALAGPAPTG
jgi:hypothetical protein